MPKLGMEPIRRAALVKATIDEIGAQGSLDVTVAQIARRAGMSSALAHHYFGSKDDIFLAAMRHTLSVYGAEVRGALSMAEGPKARVQAIIRAGFGPSNFHASVVAAWLNFWVMARINPGAARLLRIYEGRLRSNLLSNLRPLIGARAPEAAERIAALIDGVYLRQGVRMGTPDRQQAVRLVLTALDHELAG
jgi:TetR/AcrR family transcriptional repressor of bet genes